MPDLRKPSRRTLMASVIVMAGVLAMLVALLSGSSAPNSENPGQNRENRAIEPVAPLDPNDENPGTSNSTDTLDPRGDPFAASFGEEAKHKVVVRVTANGPGGVLVRYNDGKKEVKTTFSRTYSLTRTFTSRFPTVGVVAQIVPPASTGTCTVIVDGERVARDTTNKPWGYMICGG